MNAATFNKKYFNMSSGYCCMKDYLSKPYLKSLNELARTEVLLMRHGLELPLIDDALITQMKTKERYILGDAPMFAINLVPEQFEANKALITNNNNS